MTGPAHPIPPFPSSPVLPASLAGTDWSAGSEPIPGYRLLEPLGQGGYGTVWKCLAPGGLTKAIKFVPAATATLWDEDLASVEFLALERIKSIRHPFLLSLDRVEPVGDHLAIVMELADRTLLEVLHDWQARGRPGIPRSTLLSYLREAAEALDVLAGQHGLQHLDVKPNNLFLIANHVKVGDFSLVAAISAATQNGSGDRHTYQMTPLYAAPELHDGVVSRHSDQYSLAIVYQQALTGRLPFSGTNSRQLALMHSLHPPDLQPLPAADRAVVERALAKSPSQRFPSCLDFVHALLDQPQDVAPGGCPDPEQHVATQVRSANDTSRSPAPRLSHASSSVAADVARHLPGHCPVRFLGQTRISESWLVQAASGSARLARLFRPSADGQTIDLLTPLRRLHALSDSALASGILVTPAPGRALLLTNSDGPSLRERLVRREARGLAGLARAEALAWLCSAARVLDDLRQKHGMQHLGLTPDHLSLKHGKVQVAEWGVTALVELPVGQPLTATQALYAAPELRQGEVSPHCDQYSLARLFQEMVSGTPPPVGESMTATLWTAAEQVVLSRALSPRPSQRYPSASAFAEALEKASRQSACLPPLVAWSGDLPRLEPDEGLPCLSDVLADWLRETAGPVEVACTKGLFYLHDPGSSITYRGATALSLAQVHSQLDGFARQWSAHRWATSKGQHLRIELPGAFGDRWGASRSLDILVRQGQGGDRRTLLELMIRPWRAGSGAGVLLREVGPLLLENLCNHLRLCPDRRRSPRLLCAGELNVTFVEGGDRVSRPVVAQVKDLSAHGIRLLLPTMPAGQLSYVRCGANTAGGLGVLVKIVRAKSVAGGAEVGAVFSPGAG
jgi:serine/threonine protein kinase